MKLMEMARRRTAQAQKFRIRLRLSGRALDELECPKCGSKKHLGWTMKVDKEHPMTEMIARTVTFNCARCGCTDEIIKSGPVFQFIDFYCELHDRFENAKETQKVLLEEETTKLT